MTSGVIAMSGTAVSPGAVDDRSVNRAHELAEQQGCPTTSVITMVRCLQNVPAEGIIKVSKLFFFFFFIQHYRSISGHKPLLDRCIFIDPVLYQTTFVYVFSINH